MAILFQEDGEMGDALMRAICRFRSSNPNWRRTAALGRFAERRIMARER